MPRRAGRIERRQLAPDSKYHNVWVAKLINHVMESGKKSTAERIIYQAMDIAAERTKREALSIVEQAVRNVMPLVEVRPRRVGGATYQVPIEVRPERQLSLAMRWLHSAARNRRGRPMADRLAAELMDAASGQGTAVKRREDIHRMAEANRAFAHYRW